MAPLVLGLIFAVAIGLLLAPYILTIIALGLGFVLVFGGWALYGHLCSDEDDPDPSE